MNNIFYIGLDFVISGVVFLFVFNHFKKSLTYDDSLFGLGPFFLASVFGAVIMISLYGSFQCWGLIK